VNNHQRCSLDALCRFEALADVEKVSAGKIFALHQKLCDLFEWFLIH